MTFSIENAADRKDVSVLLVAADLSTGGGVNRVVTNVARILSSMLPCDVRIVSARSARPSSYPVHEKIRIDYGRSSDVGIFRYFATLLRLRRLNADFVVGFWSQDNILLMLAFAFTRARLILCEHSSHDLAPPLVRALRRLLYRFAWRVTVLNTTDLAYYSSFLNNVYLLPNPVWPCRHRSSRRRRKLIVGVGHLIPLKGFDDLLVAVQRSGLLERGWRLAIIGDGPQRSKLEEFILKEGLGSVCILPPTDQIQKWYRRAKLVVITSKSEAFSLVLAEAVQCGAVPIAYAAAGPQYLLQGFPQHLVPVGDLDALAERLKWITSCDLSGLNASIRRSISARTSPQCVASAWAELLDLR